MLHLLILIVITSTICVGLYNAFLYELDENNKPVSKSILWFWGYFLNTTLADKYINKPLGTCLRCMASVYGFLPYWWYVDFDFTLLENWYIYPFFTLAVSVVNTIFDEFIDG